jgi:adenylate kinase family enzyme
MNVKENCSNAPMITKKRLRIGLTFITGKRNLYFPIIRKKGLLKNIDGEGSIEAIFAEIKAILGGI